MEAFIEETKLMEAISFFSLTLLGIIFKAHFRSSLVEATEAITDVTKLVEAFGLESVQAIGKTVDKSVFQLFVCHMTCHSQLKLGQKLTDA